MLFTIPGQCNFNFFVSFKLFLQSRLKQTVFKCLLTQYSQCSVDLYTQVERVHKAVQYFRNNYSSCLSFPLSYIFIKN